MLLRVAAPWLHRELYVMFSTANCYQAENQSTLIEEGGIKYIFAHLCTLLIYHYENILANWKKRLPDVWGKCNFGEQDLFILIICIEGQTEI